MCISHYKKIGSFLIGSLLLLLLGCGEQNGFLEKYGEEADNKSETIDEKIRKENERLIKDKPDEDEPEDENSDEVENTVEMI